MCRRSTLRYKDWQIGIAEGGGMKTPDYSRRQAGEERAAVVRFVSRIQALGPLSPASPALQARLLEEVRAVAQRVDGSIEAGTASGYDRRVLHDDPAGWSLAAIILRPGQRTDAHDHSGWGCAATVQGVERNRRYVPRRVGSSGAERRARLPTRHGLHLRRRRCPPASRRRPAAGDSGAAFPGSRAPD